MKNVFYYDTEIGRIGISENGTSITNLYFSNDNVCNANIVETSLLKRAAQELKEYFDGSRKQFDLPLAPAGTEFQQKVWKVLQKIPYGRTLTYKQVAENIGNEKACRAVGNANNKNPIPIFIPCHRVVGSDGSLVGYAGGLDMKEKLLNIENHVG